MTSANQLISDQINEMVAKGQGTSLLQKLEFDISIKNTQELSNYITILLTLAETTTYRAEASDLLIKKVLLNSELLIIVENKKEQLYQLLYHSRVWPFIGLSEIIRRLIGTIIYNEEKDSEIIPKIPTKEFLIKLNEDLIEQFFNIRPINIETGTILLYNCWNNVEMPDRKVKLSRNAIRVYKDCLEKDTIAFDNYLHFFLRFYWYGGSREWYEGKLIVPEPFYEQIFGPENAFMNFLDRQRDNYPKLLTDDIRRLYLDIEKFIYYFKMNGQVMYDDPNVSLKIELHYHLDRELRKK